MQKALLLLFLLVTLATMSHAQSAVASAPAADAKMVAVQNQIIDIENQWNDANRKKDPAFFERHLADEYVGIYPTRKMYKSDMLAVNKSTSSILSTEGASRPSVKVYGDTAVVTGTAVYKYRDQKGEVFVTYTLYMEVFVLREGRWQCVAGQYSPLTVTE
jgi:hypothetical protein